CRRRGRRAMRALAGKARQDGGSHAALRGSAGLGGNWTATLQESAEAMDRGGTRRGETAAQSGIAGYSGWLESSAVGARLTGDNDCALGGGGRPRGGLLQRLHHCGPRKKKGHPKVPRFFFLAAWLTAYYF